MIHKNFSRKKIVWKILWIVTVIFLLCSTQVQVRASHSKNIHSLSNEKHESSQGNGSHETVKKQHETAPANEKHEPVPSAEHPETLSIPIGYKLYWIGLIFLVIFLLVYFLIMYKNKNFTSLKPLTIFLLLLALSLYLLEQGQIFTGYFDPIKGFISGFHEPNTIGFLRFLYKLIAGIALCMYGFMVFFAHKKNYKS